jgi:hypothetical protein
MKCVNCENPVPPYNEDKAAEIQALVKAALPTFTGDIRLLCAACALRLVDDLHKEANECQRQMDEIDQAHEDEERRKMQEYIEKNS